MGHWILDCCLPFPPSAHFRFSFFRMSFAQHILIAFDAHWILAFVIQNGHTFQSSTNFRFRFFRTSRPLLAADILAFVSSDLFLQQTHFHSSFCRALGDRACNSACFQIVTHRIFNLSLCHKKLFKF
jgi:hypothetical protein